MPDTISKNKTIINRLSFIGITGNLILCAFKFFAGIYGKSGAMISDAVHSMSDVIATFIAFIGVKLAQRSADSEHPYGHERFESVATFVLGLILAGTGLKIGYSALQTILSGDYSHIPVPTFLPLIAAIVSIVSKEAMFQYTMYYAKKLDSEAFKADAWHHRSDAFSSAGSFLGIGAAKLGFPVMDSIASIIICVFILKLAVEIIIDSLKKMLDTSCGTEFEEQISEFIMKESGVKRIDLLNTRMFGNKVYIDVEIAVDRNSTLLAAHKIAEDVHDEIEKHFPNVKHVMVHVNPDEE